MMLLLAQESNPGWVAGYTIGIIVVVAVVALVVPILILARSIGNRATEINASLEDSVENTSALSGLADHDRLSERDHRRPGSRPCEVGRLTCCWH